MTKIEFEKIESYMLECMKDSAHDKDHIYRVLYNALNIAKTEKNVDYDVLITASLLHDIGRKEQYENPKLSHAVVGSEKAYNYLMDNGYDADFAENVKNCILTHRFRQNEQPKTIEAKILFDADKLDVTGALGVARTLLYQGKVGEPLYSIRPDGTVSDGEGDAEPSFFQEYKYKLEKMYDRFYTKTGKELALQNKENAESFYLDLLKESRASVEDGSALLE
ncbi:MAG: HD domain-containing protein, partial [Clostridia bacterium]|nr:HD domain-containing protein [Clostridia bacterium]